MYRYIMTSAFTDKHKQQSWKHFLDLLTKASAEGNLPFLLDLFLTPAERDDLATRYEIIRSLLLAQKPQRTIAKELGLSLSKVIRGAGEVKRIPSRVKTYLKTAMQGK